MKMPCETPSTGPAAAIAAGLAAQIPELRTARLRLRAPRITDFYSYAGIVTGPRGAHFALTGRDEAWLDFNQMVAGWVLRGHGLWTVEDRQGGLLGFVLLGFDPEDPEPELGYIFSEAAEGQGYATEAATAVRDFAFGRLGWPTLVSFISPGNTRSIALAERLEAYPDGQIDDPAGGRTLIYRHPAPGGHQNA